MNVSIPRVEDDVEVHMNENGHSRRKAVCKTFMTVSFALFANQVFCMMSRCNPSVRASFIYGCDFVLMLCFDA